MGILRTVFDTLYYVCLWSKLEGFALCLRWSRNNRIAAPEAGYKNFLRALMIVPFPPPIIGGSYRPLLGLSANVWKGSLLSGLM